MSNLTVVQCRALLDRNESFSTSTGDVDSDLFLDMLNEVEATYYDLAINASPTRFLTATSISTGTNPTTVASLYTLDVLGGGIFNANADGTITDEEFTHTNRGSSATGYWIQELDAEAGAKINFTPSTIGSNTKWAVYVPYRTVLTSGSTTLFPATKAHFIKRALLRQYYLWDRNGLFNVSDADFINSLKQLIGSSNPQKEAPSLNLSSY